MLRKVPQRSKRRARIKAKIKSLRKCSRRCRRRWRRRRKLVSRGRRKRKLWRRRDRSRMRFQPWRRNLPRMSFQRARKFHRKVIPRSKRISRAKQNPPLNKTPLPPVKSSPKPTSKQTKPPQPLSQSPQPATLNLKKWSKTKQPKKQFKMKQEISWHR